MPADTAKPGEPVGPRATIDAKPTATGGKPLLDDRELTGRRGQAAPVDAYLMSAIGDTGEPNVGHFR
ncbi:MAG: hypothetical protein ACRDOI_11195 [Trebonia sp.]